MLKISTNLKTALLASLEAGSEIIKIYNSEFDVVSKSDESPLTKADLNANTVIDLFIDFPTLIKRPLLIHNTHYHIGFNADNYQKIFSL